jgi:hypothetical protein
MKTWELIVMLFACIGLLVVMYYGLWAVGPFISS